MKTRHILVACCAAIVASAVQAQQMPFSSQYYINMMSVNPAMTGSTEYAQAFLSHRSQFAGLQGGPQTSYLSVDGQTNNGKFGLGLTAMNDVTDILSRTNVMVNYSYAIKLATDHRLRFGLAVGAQNNRIAFDKAQVVDQNDQILYGPRQNQTVFNADFGLAYEWNKLQFGFAIPQLLTHQPTFNTNSGGSLIYSTSRHIRSTLKYEFTVDSKRDIVAYPMLMIRAVKGAPVQWDLNAVVDYKKWGWIGVTYHSSYAVAISAGVRYKNFTVGYAHDFVTSRVSNFSKRSSEFILSYQFGEKFRQQKEWNDQMNQRVEVLEQKTDEQSKQIEHLQLEQDSLKSELEKVKTDVKDIRNDLDTTMKDVKELQETIEKVPFSHQQVITENKEGFRVGRSGDYMNENNENAPIGYYVVVGAFGIKENAFNFKAACTEKGQTETAILLNNTNGLREVHVFYSLDKHAAIKEKQKHASQYEKIWILKLE